MPMVYDELRKVARALLRGERSDHSLQATALVHEAYLRLMGETKIPWQDRVHFFAIAARRMRHILVDHARALYTGKRCGLKVSLESALVYTEEQSAELLALNEALTRLSEWDERQSRVVELRFFGGLTEHEIAVALGVSERTVKRDWKMAKAWLYGELLKSQDDPGSIHAH